MTHRVKVAPAAVFLVALAIFALCPSCAHGHRSGPDILVVATYSLPDGIVGVAYEAVLNATRSYGPYDFSWSLDQGSGSLPDGLTLSVGGVITGKPTKAGTYSFVIKVTDSGVSPQQTATRPLRITVTGGGGMIVSTIPTPLPTGSVGFAYSATLMATGGTSSYTWSLDVGSPPLPYGITLSSGGHFTGTPTQSGSYSFVVKVIDSSTPVALVSTAPLTINISTPGQVIITTASLPKGQASQSYTYVLSATGGTTPYVWALASGALPSGFGLNSSTGEISGTTDEAGIWNFTVRVTDSTPDSPGEYTKDFSLQVDPAFSLTISTTDPLPTWQADIAFVQLIAASGGTEPYTFSVDSGTLPTGLSLSSSGILSGVPEIPGNYAFIIKVTDSTAPTPLETVKGFSHTIEPPGSITIQQETLPNAVQNNLYQTILSAVGGSTSYTWSISSGSLPSGITLAADGVISGTPTNYGIWSFVVEVTDGALTNSKPLSLTVIPELTIATVSLPDALANDAYSYSMLATGGTAPYTWSTDSGSAPLPANLMLSAGGHITGSATTSGQYSFAIKVTDSSSPTLSATKAFIINVSNIVITTTTMPDGTWGQFYSVVVTIKHNIETPLGWTWTWTAGSLPPGLSIRVSGDSETGNTVIDGDVVPGAGTQTYTFTVEVRETGSLETDQQELSITIGE